MLSPRLVFVALLSVNAVLIAKSRLGDVHGSGIIHAGFDGRSLVKRISNELLNGPEHGQCQPITVPLEDQCAHILANCPAPQTFLSIRYLQSYFCSSPSARPAIFIGLIVWLIFLFSTLGISASDFFTPNLATIATLLGLDENVAGVTFLAFGNGSPDVFSTFSAMRANSGSLAIGELLGAASFIVSCVVGSMCIIRPFDVNRGPFLRDVGFFTAAVIMLLVILLDGHIRPIEAMLMVMLYLVYVAYVVIGTWWNRRRRRREQVENLERSQYADEEPYRDDPSAPLLAPPATGRPRARSSPGPLRIQTSLPPRSSHSREPSPTSSFSHSHMPSFSLVGALEFRNVVASLQHDTPDAAPANMWDSIASLHSATPYAGGHYHSHTQSRQHSRGRTPGRTPSQPHEIDPWDETLAMPLNNRSPPTVTITSENQDGEAITPYLEEMSRSFPNISEGDDIESTYAAAPKNGVRYVLGHIAHTLFPSLHNFHNQTILGMVASVFAAPAIMLLTLTLPVVVSEYECEHPAHEKPNKSHNLVDFEEEGEERALIAEDILREEMHEMGFNKWLMAAQCVFGPLFSVGVLFRGSAHHIWLLLAALVAGIAMASLVLVFTGRISSDRAPFRMARCSMGFFVAIVWIMAIADEVVNVLQTFGLIFGLSDAIIGLTIFAVGNSLADLVANMSVAVFAPIMGFSACFGGPMLNILLGVGISGMYITSQTSEAYALHFGPTLFVSTVGLLTLLVTTLVFVPLNNYHLSRQWGVFLVCSYTALMVVNVVVELKT
ncbi:hypothetical protein CYLTODRAFT_423944 [Cylindrobasidium torrendii FP15055 ss-10]|uniref:Sodium/calcium exchanger membrane region domain-containing protein n=1 Tax=Cylindrobasidium torrendii FP15055 ss-10 TaxID=1314674 RepID=A0A0D7B5U2_9AGAR|nr:hypothetical protein CYLTODRAFT_423944 [Cylindrobasidium torrendii FP15055 ss-10]